MSGVGAHLGGAATPAPEPDIHQSGRAAPATPEERSSCSTSSAACDAAMSTRKTKKAIHAMTKIPTWHLARRLHIHRVLLDSESARGRACGQAAHYPGSLRLQAESHVTDSWKSASLSWQTMRTGPPVWKLVELVQGAAGICRASQYLHKKLTCRW